MSSGVVRCAIAAALLAAPALAAHADGYGYSYGGYDSGRYGRYGYGYQAAAGAGYGYDQGQGGYGEPGPGAPAAYGGYGGYGEGGYGYGSSPWSLPAEYCAEHLAYHQREAWMNDQAPYNNWWGTGSPEAWQARMEADHTRFHYTHPGSWRCMYQGWPAG